MEETIPREQWGWWIDVCPGKTLKLRDATDQDIGRCILNEKSSRDPSDYFCELSSHGALVNKMAAQSITELAV